MNYDDFNKNMNAISNEFEASNIINDGDEYNELISSDDYVELVPNMGRTWYYKPACTILVILYLALLLGTFGYAFIQFEFATHIRPEFIDNWIKTLDKSTLPLIFQENQKHPIVLFGLWITSVFWGLKALASLEKLSSPFFFLIKLKDIISANIKPIILGTAFLFIMNKPYIYKVAIVYFIIEFIMFYSKINKE